MGSGSSGYAVGRSGNGTLGSRDRGYKDGTTKHHSISDNLPSLLARYPYKNGYFGSPAKSSRVRHILSDSPTATARDFYERASKGGVEEPMRNGRGVKTLMGDDTVVSLREVSSSDGSPAVEINIRKSSSSGGIKNQKIHFELGSREEQR